MTTTSPFHPEPDSEPDGTQRALSCVPVTRFAFLLATLLVALMGCGGAQVGSVGAVLGRDTETQAVYIRDVPEGLAAERAGLLPGDEILMIDGVYVRSLDAKDLRARLRGEVGSTVELTVARGAAVERIRVVRGALRERSQEAPREERIEP